MEQAHNDTYQSSINEKVFSEQVKSSTIIWLKCAHFICALIVLSAYIANTMAITGGLVVCRCIGILI